MSNTPKGLGRGLEALFKSGVEKNGIENIKMVSIQQVRPNIHQPRRKYDDASLAELASSVKSQGILQPILVRPVHGSNPELFEIIAGERRWRSAGIAGMSEVPVIIKALGDMETLAVALIENLQRENLNSMEEALALRELKTEFGMSQEDVAQKIGKSRPYIANALRLLNLPENIQELLFEEALSAGHARALLSVTDKDAQMEVCRRIYEDKLSVREAESLATHWKETGTLPYDDEEEASSSGSIQPRKKSLTAKVDANFAEIESKMSKAIGMKVKLAGNLTKGKISISFSSHSEFERLLIALAPNRTTPNANL